MRRLPWLLLVATLLSAVAARATFLEKLKPEQKQRLGLDQLTAAQLAELDRAVEQYRQDGAVNAAQEAAAQAVSDYKKKEEPGVVTRALELFRRKQEQTRVEAQQVRFTAVIQGEFSGWEGGTLFPLDNGQVWKQQGSEVYSIRRAAHVPVLLYKARSGHWRLQLIEEGAWVTVTRVK